MKFLLPAFLLATVASASFHRCPRYKVIVFSDTAADAHGLNHTVLKFRETLGGENNNNLFGPLARGHRIINWDAAMVPFDMPGDFFNTEVTRGAVFRTKTGEFRVSNPVDEDIVDDRFDSIVGKRIARMFVRFSLFRLFTPLNSNKMTMTFRIPAKDGLGDRATSSGFGAVFTDVDLKKLTSLSFFDKKGCFIAKVFVPPRSKGLSFAGIVVIGKRHKPIAVIDKVKFSLGDIAIAKLARKSKHSHFGHFGHFGHSVYSSRFGKFGKKKFADVVVMDDFIYGEPQEH